MDFRYRDLYQNDEKKAAVFQMWINAGVLKALNFYEMNALVDKVVSITRKKLGQEDIQMTEDYENSIRLTVFYPTNAHMVRKKSPETIADVMVKTYKENRSSIENE